MNFDQRLKIIRDIVVIGAPIGGAASLIELARAFPADLPAAIVVVLHALPEKPILLADALSAPGQMRATEAADGEPLQQGRIYVAADGKNLRLDQDRIRVTESAGQSSCCPSIDVLFRSAAEHHHQRIIGVVLLHLAVEGALGLHAIREHGGRTITHRNELMRDAPSHPQTGETLAHDHLPLERIAKCIVAYVNNENGGGLPLPS